MEKVIFIKDPRAYSDNAVFVAHLAKVTDEEELFKQLSTKLNFPNYFGFNWNAVYDCLRDFHWIEKKGILLVHDEFPELNKLVLKTYLQTLIQAIQDWKDGEEHYLKVVFPEQSKELIEKYLVP